MSRMTWLAILMGITIIAITGFQLYWLRESYERERTSLQIKTEFAFRNSIMDLQMSKINLEGIHMNDSSGVRMVVDSGTGRVSMKRREGMISTINIVRDKINKRKTGIIVPADRMVFTMKNTTVTPDGDTIVFNRTGTNPQVFNFLSGVDSLQDKITAAEIDSSFAALLAVQRINVPYTINSLPGARSQGQGGAELTIGFKNPVTYSLSLGNTMPYLLGQIKFPILFSILLLGITIVSFLLLYKNVLQQQRLNTIKNDFISNITHELKTPVATVSVAIEALKNFNAIDDPQKTREYLDISSDELERLNLLVDRVLKLSMIERKDLELKYEPLNLIDLVSEVIGSLKLQLEKREAGISMKYTGDLDMQGDRHHLLSVLFNLVDNSMKYSKGQPEIDIRLHGTDEWIEITVSDKGIGIPKEYQEKIFEKFFRVPHGNRHDAKGYGLGLSYVASVIKKHKGTVAVRSGSEGGASIILTLPKYPHGPR